MAEIRLKKTRDAYKTHKPLFRSEADNIYKMPVSHATCLEPKFCVCGCSTCKEVKQKLSEN